MNKFTSYAFWVALAGAIVVLLNDVSKLIGIEINTSIIESVMLSACGVFVVLGLIHKDTDDVDNSQDDNDFDHPDDELK